MTQPAPYSKRSLSYCAAILCNRFIKLYMLARLVRTAEGDDLRRLARRDRQTRACRDGQMDGVVIGGDIISACFRLRIAISSAHKIGRQNTCKPRQPKRRSSTTLFECVASVPSTAPASIE